MPLSLLLITFPGATEELI